MHASLIIPCYNEGKSLPMLVERCKAAVQAEPDLDVILVDNGSTDESPDLMAQISGEAGLGTVRVDKNRGYGNGILVGLSAARGDVLGWTHADLQTDPMDAVAALKIFKSAGDWERLYVKGRRRGRPLGDELFTAGMSAFETLLLRTPLVDINAQPNLFPRALFESWARAPSDFSLDLFAYHSAKLAGYRVVRFPVEFRERQHGHSHWNIDWRSKLKFIKRTLDYSFELERNLRRSSR